MRMLGSAQMNAGPERERPLRRAIQGALARPPMGGPKHLAAPADGLPVALYLHVLFPFRISRRPRRVASRRADGLLRIHDHPALSRQADPRRRQRTPRQRTHPQRRQISPNRRKTVMLNLVGSAP